jgi:membrane protease YdiL (CAAX protease family)
MDVEDSNERLDADSQRTVHGVGIALRFYLLTFTISWLVWGSAIFWSGLEDWEPLIIMVGAYGPLLAAVLVPKLTRGSPFPFRRLASLRGRVRWVLIGSLGLPLVIAVAHVVLYRATGDVVSLSTDPPWYFAVAAAPINILLLFWLGSAMEEFGWQGVAVPALLDRMDPLAAAGLHGLIWGTWHVPLFFVDSWKGGGQSVVVLFGITVALSPIMIWLTQSAAGGVMPAVLFHAATNHYTSVFTESGDKALFNPALEGWFDEIKLAIYVVVALAVIVATRGRLGRSADATGSLRITRHGC